MFLVGMISWWYGRGWVTQWGRIAQRWSRTAEFFSIGQLVSTLFSPWRQISAGRVDGPVGAVLRGLIDQLISRIIGAIVRFFTIIIGVVVLAFQVIYETLIMLVWWFLPTFPIIGAVLFAIGWVPLWR